MSPLNTTTPLQRSKPHPYFPDAGRPTWEVAYLFPAQGEWSEDDFLGLDALSDLAPFLELSRGRLEILSMPTELHQLIVAYLYELLKAFTQQSAPGTVLFSGMRVRLKKGRFRGPDILYLKSEHDAQRKEKYWEGADLVMEVVSKDPKDHHRDWIVKKREYARAGIAEYWIVDPQEERIQVLTLIGNAYQIHGDFRPGRDATSALLPGFSVAVDEALMPSGTSRR